MSQFFKETAHLKTDRDKYGENYDRIFALQDWIQVSETIIISREDIANNKATYKPRKISLRAKLRGFWWSIRWELSNFILERD